MRNKDHYHPYFRAEEKKVWRGLAYQHHNLELKEVSLGTTGILCQHQDRQTNSGDAVKFETMGRRGYH